MNYDMLLDRLKARLNLYKEKMGYNYFAYYALEVKQGKKYDKVFSYHIGHDGKIQGQENLICFISKENGDIFKPASYRSPAKHKRGNIFSIEYGMEAFDERGNVYYLK